jgi:Phosphotransferase enzyme family
MHPKLWLAQRAGAIALAMAQERLRPSPPRTRADVPRDAGQVSAAWLTDVLCAEHPGAMVERVEIEAGTSQTTERAGLRVAYNDAGAAAGLPTQLFMKTTTSFPQRLLLGGAHMLHGETQFYTRFRPGIEMEAPLGYWGGVDERSWRSMVLMEDIAATKRATFIEPVTALTHAQVQEVIGNLAACHGAWWGDPALDDLKTTRDHLRYVSSFIDMGKGCATGFAKAADLIPERMRGQAERVWRGTERSLSELGTQPPRTLLHGDLHVGQFYITGDGHTGITDWQSIMSGSWGYDFAYFVGSACDPENRRAWERDLLELYLERVREAGGDPPDFDAAWLVYRQNLCYPCGAWAWAYGRAFYQPEMQPEDACRLVIARLTTAIDDLDALDAIGV